MLKTFKVTKETLKESVRLLEEDQWRATEKCALAIPIRQQYPQAWVGLIKVNNLYGKGEMVNLSKEAIEYRRLFDNSSSEERLNLPEFEFQLEIPDGI